MVASTPADRIAAKFQAAALRLAERLHPDTYTVVRTVRVNDGYGGMTSTESPVETGQCRLDVSSGGREGVSGNVIESVSSYIVELPRDTDLQASDGLTVNGREFEVVDIRRGGEFDMFTVAGVEERGMISIDVVSNRFPQLAASLGDTLEAALDAGVMTCVAVADPMTPVDTGMLKGNKSIEGGAGSRTITWNQDYAAYQELGTSRGVPANGFAAAGADAAGAVIESELGRWPG